MGQNSVVTYSQAIQAHLQAIVSPVPVFAAFNRNFSSTPKFVVWMLRDVHQPVPQPKPQTPPWSATCSGPLQKPPKPDVMC